MDHASQPSPGRFQPTRWSLVQIAAMPEGPQQRRALSELLSLYLPPMRGHLTRKWRSVADRADDLLQAFISDRLLERNLLANADRERGKFRSFLLTSLDHFVANLLRAERTQKLGGHAAIALPADFEVPDDSHPHVERFSYEWAHTVLQEAAARMKDECDASHRPRIWLVFESRVLQPATDGSATIGYEELVNKFGLPSPREASNLLVTGKRMFLRKLREVVGGYVDEPANIDAEIRELRAILAGGARWVR